MHRGSRYAVNPGFRIRRERFGCLMYNHAEGALLALRSPVLTHLLTNAGGKSVAELVSAVSGRVEPPAALLDQVLEALRKLERRGIIHEV